MRHKNVIKAFLLAPLIPSGVFALFFVAMGMFYAIKEGNNYLAILYGGPIWFLLALPVAYAVTFMFGVPGYIVYVKKGITNLKAYLLGGAILGFASPVLLSFIIEIEEVMKMGVWLFLAGALFGATTSYTFWRIAIENPNK